MQRDLVSIITPCYNMEKVLFRLLDSIIAQTYRPIQFILVDDGSTDQSINIAKSYQDRFIQAGIDYIIVHQENRGLAGAINAGLSKVSGEFICWPDADDYLEPSSVEERVEAIRSHPDCAVVTSNAYVLHENSMASKTLLVDGTQKIHNNPKQFLHLLNEQSIYCPGCHLVRAECFFDVNPDGCIYPARRGQNWQMLLPLYYKYERYFLNQPLYNYVVYQGSMSRGDDRYESRLYRFNEHETILRETLTKIQTVQKTDMAQYIHYIKDRYAKFRMELAIKYRKTDAFIDEYTRKKESIGVDFCDKISFIRNAMPQFDKPLAFVCRISRFILRRTKWRFAER